MNSRIALTNGKAYTEHEVIEDAAVLISNGKIESLGKTEEITIPTSYRKFNVRGKAICPGFIDIHINGGGRALVMDGTYEAICAVARAHAKYGVTGILPTTVAWSDEEQLTAIDAVLEAIERGTKGARPLGIHMEGPFLNPAKRGTHNPDFLLEPSKSKFDMFFSAARGHLRLMTLSPELPGALDLIRHARRKGVAISAGHTVATYEQTVEAIDAGLQIGTHIFNAMAGISAREPGPAVALLESPKTMVAVLTDGVHVHPGLVRLILQIKNSDSVVIVTDATPPSGTDDTTWKLEDFTVTIRGYTGYLDNGTIAGSALTMNSAAKITKRMTGLPLEKLLPMTSLNQARLLGIDNKKGSILTGKDADIVVLSDDQDLEVMMTIVEGEIVHQQP
jgi:N-acetylglucosamine-6-phosphate deacetylase